MKKSKSKAELQAEVNILRNTHISNNLTKLSRTVVKVLGTVAIFFFIRDMVVAMAGQETVGALTFNTNIITDLKANQAMVTLAGVLFGTGGVSYGVAQRNSKQKSISRLSMRKEELEKRLDPGRQSSSLTTNGTTRPEDI